jgi:glycosyltransferase involved in cell wall biosynthesis
MYHIVRNDIRALWVSCGGGLFPIFLLNKLTNVKVLLQYDHTLFSTTNSKIKRRVFMAIERFLLNFVDYAIVTTKETRKFVGDKCYIVPDINKGIDTSLYDPKTVREHPFYSNKRDKPTILFVGRMEKEKDPLTLIRAFYMLKGTHPNVNLVFCGDGSILYEIIHIEQELYHDPYIDFLGKVEDVPEMLKGADIFVIPSIRDPTPKALLEAMAMGKCCIGSCIPGIKDLLGDSGILLPAKDADKLAYWMKFLIEEPDFRSYVGDKARERALEMYDIKKNITKEVKFLKREIEHGRKPL